MGAQKLCYIIQAALTREVVREYHFILNSDSSLKNFIGIDLSKLSLNCAIVVVTGPAQFTQARPPLQISHITGKHLDRYMEAWDTWTR